jgi:hypothetical protein
VNSDADLKALVDDSMGEGAEFASMTGVVEPVLPGMEPPPSADGEIQPLEDAFGTARRSVEGALEAVRQELVTLRDARSVLNNRVRTLVAEEKVLSSMARIMEKGPGDGE